MREHPAGFVDHHEMIVFVHDANHAALYREVDSAPEDP